MFAGICVHGHLSVFLCTRLQLLLLEPGQKAIAVTLQFAVTEIDTVKQWR